MIAGGLVDVARDFARRRAWTTSGLQSAKLAVVFTGEVTIGVISGELAGSFQGFAGRTDVKIALGVICEVST